MEKFGRRGLVIRRSGLMVRRGGSWSAAGARGPPQRIEIPFGPQRMAQSGTTLAIVNETTGKAATYLLVQDDGSVALYTAAKHVVWKAP